MKRIFCLLFLITCLAEARFFMGFEGGVSYSMSYQSYGFIEESEGFRITHLYGGYMGVNLGTEHYFARDSLLFRWFLSAGGDVGVAYGDLNLGIDFMGTLYKSDASAFGIFLGIEMSTVFKDGISGFCGAFRLGVSTLVSSEHRIELYLEEKIGGLFCSST